MRMAATRFSVTLRSKVKVVTKMFQAIHGPESKKAVQEKAKKVVGELCSIVRKNVDTSHLEGGVSGKNRKY